MNQTSKATIIRIATDFSAVPAGRFYTDGPNSGQRFRDELLIPKLEEFQKILIDLDEAEGYGSSFLEESFGGLIREAGYEKGELLDRFSFKSEEDPSLISEIRSYLNDAEPRA